MAGHLLALIVGQGLTQGRGDGPELGSEGQPRRGGGRIAQPGQHPVVDRGRAPVDADPVWEWAPRRSVPPVRSRRVPDRPRAVWLASPQPASDGEPVRG